MSEEERPIESPWPEHPALLARPDALSLTVDGEVRLPDPENFWHGAFLESARDQRGAVRVAALEDTSGLEASLRRAGPLDGTRVLGIYGHAGSGRSTVALAAARALRELGRTVGVLDADLQNPSLRRRLGAEAPPLVVGGLVLTMPVHGVRLQSLQAFWPEAGPLPWQGRELARVLSRYREDVHWGRPDVLVIDLPPLGDPRLAEVAAHFGGETWRVDGALGSAIAGPAPKRRIRNAGGAGGDVQLPYAPDGDLLSTLASRLRPLLESDGWNGSGSSS